MLFHIYGANAGYQLLGWALAFIGLVALNEIGRRTKKGGIALFFILPIILTIYFIAIYIGAAAGASWALNNQTYKWMNSWFHYAKLYAATIGCIGFILIKYKKSIGAKDWFKIFPFLIVAINILIAVGSDFESCIRGGITGGWWLSSEGVWLYGGWWNLLNGIAGLINIFCMTSWWGIYSSKKGEDMLWPDMTWVYILAYDVWNFQYTYLNLPNHSWYCGLALLLAPTFAAFMYNKGGWIQNRAFTLSLWCMFAQVFPNFLDRSRFSVVSVIYKDPIMAHATSGVAPVVGNVVPQGVISILSILINAFVLVYIIHRSVTIKINPYKSDVFTFQKDYKDAVARIEK